MNMDMKEIMQQRSFAVFGDTLNPEKYAYKIKNSMLEAGYRVYPVGKELQSVNDIEDEIDVIDLCMNPARSLELLKENRKSFKCIVIQPGADSPELIKWLDENSIPRINGCLLAGLSSYR